MEKQLNSSSEPAPAVSSDFSKIVEESKVTIQNAEIQPVKAGRGRKKLPRDAQGNIIRDPKSGRVVPGSADASPSVATGTQGPLPPPPDISKSLIVPLKSLSNIPASRFNVAEIAFDDAEAEALAKSLSDLYGAFAPAGQMNPRTAAICNFGLVAGTLLFTKYQIYREKCAPPPISDEPVENLPTGQTFPTMDAADVFRRRQ